MSWQATLLLCSYIGWVGLHSWLGKKRFLRTLAALVVLELAAFVGLLIWLQKQDYHASAGAVVVLTLFAGALVLLVPAVVGAYSFWKNGTARAL
jgi:hypothetical protein